MGRYVSNILMSDEKIQQEAKVSGIVLVPHICAIFIAIGLFTIIKPIIAMLTTELAVTNYKIIGKTGFIKTSEMSSPLTAIQNVSVEQGFWGKVFKYGTIKITTTSGAYKYSYIKNPSEFRTTVLNQIEISKKDEMKRNAQEIANAMKN